MTDTLTNLIVADRNRVVHIIANSLHLGLEVLLFLGSGLFHGLLFLLEIELLLEQIVCVFLGLHVQHD